MIHCCYLVLYYAHSYFCRFFLFLTYGNNPKTQKKLASLVAHFLGLPILEARKANYTHCFADQFQFSVSFQSYTSNGAKVIFLNQRPQTRPPRLSGNVCYACDRTLQEPYLFCSLYCKVPTNSSLLLNSFTILSMTQFISSLFLV